jgi:putative membrane protein
LHSAVCVLLLDAVVSKTSQHRKEMHMRSSLFLTSIAAAIASLSLSSAFAQSDQSDSGSNSGKTSLSAQEFVTRAAQSNFAEIKVSQLAESKAQSDEVKAFAKKMIDDHTQANSQLAQLAKTKNLKVPDDADMMHKASMKMLQVKSGSGFDSAFMEQMNKDHQKAIELFQSAATSTQLDPELKAFAAKVLPKLQDHHQLVAQIEQKMPSKAASKESSSSSR